MLAKVESVLSVGIAKAASEVRTELVRREGRRLWERSVWKPFWVIDCKETRQQQRPTICL